MKDPHVYQQKTQRQRFHLNHRQMVWTVILFCGLLLGVIGYVVVSTNMRHDDASTKVRQAIDQASKSMERGDYRTAKSKLKAVEDVGARKSDRVQIYSVLASIAMAENQVGEVISNLEKKHALDPGSAKKDALNLATYYHRIGEREKAMRQYKIAIAYLETQPEGIQRNMDLSAAKVRLEALRGEVQE